MSLTPFKATNAYKSGAKVLIIVDNVQEDLDFHPIAVTGGSAAHIPSMVVSQKTGEAMIAILSGSDEAAAKSVILSFTNPMTKSSIVNLTMVLSPDERDSYAFMESYNQMAEAIGDDVTYDFKFNIYSCPNCMADVKSNNCVDTDGLYCKFASKFFRKINF